MARRRYTQQERETQAQPVARTAIRVSHIQADKKREIAAESSGEERNEEAYASRGIVSPGVQLSKAEHFCAIRDWTFDKENSWKYRDLDVSGRKPWRSRPGMMAHYEAAKRGEFQFLIFYKISRLARNVREALDLIDAFEATGVQLAFVSDSIDPTTAAGKMVRTIMLAVAQMQAEEIGEYISDSITKRAKASAEAIAQGRPEDVSLPNMALPVWLYRDNGVILPHGPTVEAIRRMIELRVTGQGGQTTITRRLNAEGYRTPRGNLWRPDKIWKYMEDEWIERMLGTAFINHDLPKGDHDRVEIPNYFPQIISEEEAKQLRHVQALYRKAPLPDALGKTGNTWATNKAKRKNTHLSTDTDYLVSGVTWCTCGQRMTARDKGCGRHAYECALWRTNPTKHDAGTQVTADVMHDAVLRVVRHFLEFLPKTKPNKPARKPARKHTRTLEQIDEEIARLLKLYTQGRVEEVDYDREYRALAQERETIMAGEREEAQPTALDAVRALADGSGEPKREELRQLVLLTVERVDANVTTGELVPRSGGLRRFVRVTMKYTDANGKRVFLAPLHDARYTGERTITAVD